VERCLLNTAACLAHFRMGKSACKGRSIRMDTLDNLVIDHLSRRLALSGTASKMGCKSCGVGERPLWCA